MENVSSHNSKVRSCMKEVFLLIFITAMEFKQSSQVLQYLLLSVHSLPSAKCFLYEPSNDTSNDYEIAMSHAQ